MLNQVKNAFWLNVKDFSLQIFGILRQFIQNIIFIFHIKLI